MAIQAYGTGVFGKKLLALSLVVAVILLASFLFVMRDPERARQYLLDQDALLEGHIRESADQLNMRVISIDTDTSPGDLATAVARFLGLSLSPGESR